MIAPGLGVPLAGAIAQPSASPPGVGPQRDPRCRRPPESGVGGTLSPQHMAHMTMSTPHVVQLPGPTKTFIESKRCSETCRSFLGLCANDCLQGPYGPDETLIELALTHKNQTDIFVE